MGPTDNHRRRDPSLPSTLDGSSEYVATVGGWVGGWVGGGATLLMGDHIPPPSPTPDKPLIELGYRQLLKLFCIITQAH